MKNPENKKEWIVDEEVAEVVREIFRLCVSGHGPTQIANMLVEREILCPTYYALERGEKPRTALPPHKYAWNGPVVAQILDRMDYLGHTVNFKTHVKSYKHHKTIHNTPDQWKIFEDTQEAIIDKKTFEIVQKIRAGKRRPGIPHARTHNSKPKKHPYERLAIPSFSFHLFRSHLFNVC